MKLEMKPDSRVIKRTVVEKYVNITLQQINSIINGTHGYVSLEALAELEYVKYGLRKLIGGRNAN